MQAVAGNLYFIDASSMESAHLNIKKKDFLTSKCKKIKQKIKQLSLFKVCIRAPIDKKVDIFEPYTESAVEKCPKWNI